MFFDEAKNLLRFYCFLFFHQSFSPSSLRFFSYTKRCFSVFYFRGLKTPRKAILIVVELEIWDLKYETTISRLTSCSSSSDEADALAGRAYMMNTWWARSTLDGNYSNEASSYRRASDASRWTGDVYWIWLVLRKVCVSRMWLIFSEKKNQTPWLVVSAPSKQDVYFFWWLKKVFINAKHFWRILIFLKDKISVVEKIWNFYTKKLIKSEKQKIGKS